MEPKKIPLPSKLNKTGLFNLICTFLILTLSPNRATPSRSWWLGLSLVPLAMAVGWQIYVIREWGRPGGVRADGTLENADAFNRALRFCLCLDILLTACTLYSLQLLKSLQSSQFVITMASNFINKNIPLLNIALTRPLISIGIIIAISSLLKSMQYHEDQSEGVIEGTFLNAFSSILPCSASEVSRAHKGLLQKESQISET